uniref:Uncharacterized protein n=1 Tax=Alexandrium andersonii TaxID=327968 RepID=A0A7S2CM24_9DINO
MDLIGERQASRLGRQVELGSEMRRQAEPCTGREVSPEPAELPLPSPASVEEAVDEAVRLPASEPWSPTVVPQLISEPQPAGESSASEGATDSKAVAEAASIPVECQSPTACEMQAYLDMGVVPWAQDDCSDSFVGQFSDCDNGEEASQHLCRRAPRQLLPSLLEDTSSRWMWEVEQARAKLRNPLARPKSHNGAVGQDKLLGQDRMLSEVNQVRAMLRPSPGPRKSWTPADQPSTSSSCTGFERWKGKFVTRRNSSLEGFIEAKMSARGEADD